MTIFAYGAPAVGLGYMYLLMSLYVLYFSTNVLLISPAVMGTVFAASRIWDAISDPIVGYWSDRTGARLGRRRSWMLASIVPTAGLFLMVFSAPAGLSSSGLIIWMTIAVIGFYAVATMLFVPHMSLGAELSVDYHERSKLYGARHGFYTLGSIAALGSMYVFTNSGALPVDKLRSLVTEHATLAGVALAVLVVFAITRLQERPEFQGRAAESPFSAFRDVWGNPHARLLILVTFIENIGGAAIGVLTLFIAEYVVGAPELAALIILCYMVPSTVLVPIWAPLSKRYSKKFMWMFSMVLTGLSFGGMISLLFIDTLSARLWTICVLAVTAGIAAGCGGTISPSVQSDVIDFDEHETGERKEGTYFAAWNFVYKSAYGVMLLLTGYVLSLSGFEPNVEQTMAVKWAMITLYGAFPLVCYLVGAWLFSKFRLNEAEHAEIRTELERRAVIREQTLDKSGRILGEGNV